MYKQIQSSADAIKAQHLGRTGTKNCQILLVKMEVHRFGANQMQLFNKIF